MVTGTLLEFGGGVAILGECILKSELGGTKNSWFRGEGTTGVGGPLLSEKDLLG